MPANVLAETRWVAENLDNPEVRLIEVSSLADPEGYDKGHIPGAVNWTWQESHDFCVGIPPAGYCCGRSIESALPAEGGAERSDSGFIDRQDGCPKTQSNFWGKTGNARIAGQKAASLMGLIP